MVYVFQVQIMARLLIASITNVRPHGRTTMEETMFGIDKIGPSPKGGRPRKVIGQKPPLKLKEVWAIRMRLQGEPSSCNRTPGVRFSSR